MKLSTTERKRYRVSNKVKSFSRPDRFRLTLSRTSKNISAQIIDDSKNVTLFLSSIIWAEIFLLERNMLNLNLSGLEIFLSLFLTLNFFLSLVDIFIIFSFLLFSKYIDQVP